MKKSINIIVLILSFVLFVASLQFWSLIFNEQSIDNMQASDHTLEIATTPMYLSITSDNLSPNTTKIYNLLLPFTFINLVVVAVLTYVKSTKLKNRLLRLNILNAAVFSALSLYYFRFGITSTAVEYGKTQIVSGFIRTYISTDPYVAFDSIVVYNYLVPIAFALAIVSISIIQRNEMDLNISHKRA